MGCWLEIYDKVLMFNCNDKILTIWRLKDNDGYFNPSNNHQKLSLLES